MISLLLVTTHPEIGEALAAFSREHSFRLRTVATLGAARDWLSLQPFQALIVDREVDPLRANDLLEVGWKYSPMMSGIILSTKPAEEAWMATLLGAKVFIGDNAISRLKMYLLSLPRSISLVPEKHHKILFAEDLDAAREIITSYIESLGFEHVEGVGSGSAALARLVADPEDYFCVLADIRMPGMNGILLAEHVRRAPETAHIPVVILTAEPTTDHLVDSLRAGVTGFLAKPPKKAALLKELEKARRIVALKQSPRLCELDEVPQLEEAIRRRS